MGGMHCCCHGVFIECVHGVWLQGRMTRAVEVAAAGLQMGDPNRLTLARVIGQGSWGVVYRGAQA